MRYYRMLMLGFMIPVALSTELKHTKVAHSLNCTSEFCYIPTTLKSKIYKVLGTDIQ
jgi:hypothetical protein